MTDMLPEQHHGLTKSDPLWFKRAVFYEVLVRSFKDSNADGIGDLQGLTEKLDYLEWLGVDCLWLPPFYPSPLRDGGYDISDYTNVMPEVGTIADFAAFMEAAHARGIRVIVDFVMNHTSDQHPWFQESRNDPDGPYGDFYVWSDTDDGVRRRADHLRRHRDVELDLGPGPRAVLLAPVLLQPARPELREPGRRRRDDRGAEVLARPRRRRVPAGRGAVPVRGGGHQLREPARDARVPASGSARRSTRTTPTVSCCARRTSGRATWSSTSATASPAVTSARWRSTSR